MDFSRQSPRAARIHDEYLVAGQRTCIDCHKGMAHELPDMTGVEPGWQVPPELRAGAGGAPGQALARFLEGAEAARP